MPQETEPARMTASEVSAVLATRALSAEEDLRFCLKRIAARDVDVKAWAYLDPDQAIRRTCEMSRVGASICRGVSMRRRPT